MGTGAEERISGNCTQKLLYKKNLGWSRGISLERLSIKHERNTAKRNVPEWATIRRFSRGGSNRDAGCGNSYGSSIIGLSGRSPNADSVLSGRGEPDRGGFPPSGQMQRGVSLS